MDLFLQKEDAREFWFLAAATFLVFLTHSKLAFLSVILRDVGLGASEIGVVLSTPLIPILAGMYLTGHLVDRFGPLRVIRSGFFLMLAAYLTLQVTVYSLPGVILTRIAYGFGYGIFMPAAMVTIKNRLRPERMVYMVGIYGSMLLLPNLIGPAIMEYLYGRFGLSYLFWYTAVPAALGNMVMMLARREPAGSLRPDPGGYLGLLKKREIHLPVTILVIVGLVYGFVPTLMALLLRGYAIPVAMFFVPFTASLFLGRFVILPLISSWPRKVPILAGLVSMATAHVMVQHFQTPAAALTAGIIFGVGYSLEYPNISVWVAQQFRQEDRGKPVALLNMIYHAGIFMAPLIGGWVMEVWSLGAMSLLLAGLAMVTAAVLIFFRVPDVAGQEVEAI